MGSKHAYLTRKKHRLDGAYDRSVRRRVHRRDSRYDLSGGFSAVLQNDYAVRTQKIQAFCRGSMGHKLRGQNLRVSLCLLFVLFFPTYLFLRVMKSICFFLTHCQHIHNTPILTQCQQQKHSYTNCKNRRPKEAPAFF